MTDGMICDYPQRSACECACATHPEGGCSCPCAVHRQVPGIPDFWRVVSEMQAESAESFSPPCLLLPPHLDTPLVRAAVARVLPGVRIVTTTRAT